MIGWRLWDRLCHPSSSSCELLNDPDRLLAKRALRFLDIGLDPLLEAFRVKNVQALRYEAHLLTLFVLS